MPRHHYIINGIEIWSGSPSPEPSTKSRQKSKPSSSSVKQSTTKSPISYSSPKKSTNSLSSNKYRYVNGLKNTNGSTSSLSVKDFLFKLKNEKRKKNVDRAFSLFVYYLLVYLLSSFLLKFVHSYQ